MRIITLSDNHALETTSCSAEHGFSMYIEDGERKILFDTGCGSLFLENAERLKVDLSLIDTLIISHGHYDHGGGVRPLLEKFSYDALQMFTGEGFFHRKFVREEGKERNTGLDFDAAFLDSKGVDYQQVGKDPVMIGEGIYLLSRFSGNEENEDLNPRFLTEDKNGVHIDAFNDEVSLVFESADGIVMVAGCSHPGILRMIEKVEDTFGKQVKTLLGGIHLFDATEEKMKKVSDALLEKGIETLGVSHCTGEAAEEYLAERTAHYFLNAAGTERSL